MSGSRARLSSTIRRAVDGTLGSPDKDTDGGGSLIPMANTLIGHAERGGVFTRAEAEAVMEELLSGRVETAEIVRLLTAMNRRAVGAAELTGFASVMRKFAAPVFDAGESLPLQMVDTCGTGGDGFDAFNVSTAAAIVAAAAGARVAKHGNRAASSRSGSADVLEALGIPTDLGPEEAKIALAERGFAFSMPSASLTMTAARLNGAEAGNVKAGFTQVSFSASPLMAQAQMQVTGGLQTGTLVPSFHTGDTRQSLPHFVN